MINALRRLVAALFGDPPVQYIVYQTSPASGTQHLLLRSGDAPSDMIAMQAGSGETAIAWAGTVPTAALDSGVTWFFDTASSAFVSIAAPLPAPSGTAHEERARALIKQRLRDTEWTQLPDAPLTSGQKADYATYRADLRALANNGSLPLGTLAAFGISWDFGGGPPEFAGA